MKKIAVIAGTPIDTQMGVDYLTEKAEAEKADIETVYLPAFENPRLCHIFQMEDQLEKENKMVQLFQKGKDMGADSFFIYCNSLSAAFNYDHFGAKLGVKTVTPLNAYSLIAKKYNKVGVIAANNQATAGIEKSFTDSNPSCYVMGLGMLDLVEAVESKLPSDKIVEKYRLSELANFFKANDAEALVLGCTHFPYFKDALEKTTDLEIIDPADLMFELVME